jgi:uncharacterized membrane protein
VRTERGFDRLVNFSDAVVAIAITLLILPLVDTAANLHGANAGSFIAKNEFKLFVFVLSFAVIGRFWLVHHKMYEYVIGYNDGILWANILWLLSIVFLPFPTELLASSNRHERTVYALYVGTMLVSSAALLLQQWMYTRSPELQSERVRGKLTLIPAAVNTGLMLVAFVIAVTLPAIGLWGLLLLFLAEPIERVLMRNRQTASALG